MTALITHINPELFTEQWTCGDCNGFYFGKTKRGLHDRKTKHFKALAKNDNTSAIDDRIKTTGPVASSGITLIFWRRAKPTTIAESKRPYLFKRGVNRGM